MLAIINTICTLSTAFLNRLAEWSYHKTKLTQSKSVWCCHISFMPLLQKTPLHMLQIYKAKHTCSLLIQPITTPYRIIEKQTHINLPCHMHHFPVINSGFRWKITKPTFWSSCCHEAFLYYFISIINFCRMPAQRCVGVVDAVFILYDWDNWQCYGCCLFINLVCFVLLQYIVLGLLLN